MGDLESSYPVWFGALGAWSLGEKWRVGLAHARKRHVLIFIKRGQGKALLCGTRHGLGTHNLLSLPPDTLFSLDFIPPVTGFVLSLEDPSAFTMPKTPWLLRLRDVDAIGDATLLFEAGMREVERGRPLVHDALNAHARLAAIWLRRRIAEEDPLPLPSDPATKLTGRFFALAAKSEPGLLSLRAHADALGVSPTHLSRSCKAATGRTAPDLLNEQVIHRARELLAQKDIDVQDIARHLGFGTAAYFSRFIRTHVGRPPTELRRASR